MSDDEIQMEEVHDGGIMKTEKPLKNNDVDIDMETSSNDKDELNVEDSMDANMYTFLTDEKR